jgi:TRAP-type C4-dicarboxylate transport system permease small subunit
MIKKTINTVAVVRILENGLDFIGCASLIIVLASAFVNVLSRYILNRPLPWADEVCTSFFVWIIFCGAAVKYRHSDHVSIDFFVDIMPSFCQKIVNIVVDVIMIVSNVYFAYLGYVLSVSAFVKRTPLLKISYFYIDISVTIGFGIMALYACRNVRRTFKWGNHSGRKES